MKPNSQSSISRINGFFENFFHNPIPKLLKRGFTAYITSPSIPCDSSLICAHETYFPSIFTDLYNKSPLSATGSHILSPTKGPTTSTLCLLCNIFANKYARPRQLP